MMMNNLFLMFDPSSSSNLSINWLAVFMPIIFFNKTYYIMIIKSRFYFMMNLLLSFVMNDLYNNLKKTIQKNMVFFIMYFFFIMFSNLLSIFPFIFTPTSHMTTNLSLSLPFWFSLFLMSWIELTNKSFSHLVPMGAPLLLSPFMVLIETISNIIRPLTLAIRLTANMIAGHILISLLSTMLNNNYLIFLTTSIILNMLLILEISVSIIQSYVFIILLSLYMQELA